jgi:hypothetical protein
MVSAMKLINIYLVYHFARKYLCAIISMRIQYVYAKLILYKDKRSDNSTFIYYE